MTTLVHIGSRDWPEEQNEQSSHGLPAPIEIQREDKATIPEVPSPKAACTNQLDEKHVSVQGEAGTDPATTKVPIHTPQGHGQGPDHVDIDVVPIPPPDVGLQPWLQVIAGHFLMFNSWGLVVSYGSFQTYYTTQIAHSGNYPLQSASKNASAIAWIGSIQNTLLLVGGALGGKYFDAGYFRQMLGLGTFLVVFGTLMTSLVKEYYQAVLAQGVCVGLGMGMLLVPSVALPSTWFHKRRGLAVGIVSSGASLGGIVIPIGLRHSISSVGFGWAVRILALMSLVTLLVSNLLIRQRLPPRPAKGARFIEYQALREQREFALWTAGQFVTYFGFFGFYNYVEAWAESIGLDRHSSGGGFPLEYLLPVLNAASILGRLIPCFIADYTGPLNIQGPSLFVTALLVFVWIPCRTLGGLLAITVLYGFFSGAVIATPPAVVASMTEDLRRFGGRMGVMFLTMACSSLVGPPVMGAIIEMHGGSYDAAKVYAGAMIMGGTVLVWLSRLYKTGLRVVVKA
ncbi:Major Facilitator Superfamily protein [Fonsecaea pedrosoi]|nr:Major Facilitator Superfamily protein [Fonsecaea pedrosoi]